MATIPAGAGGAAARAVGVSRDPVPLTRPRRYEMGGRSSLTPRARLGAATVGAHVLQDFLATTTRILHLHFAREEARSSQK